MSLLSQASTVKAENPDTKRGPWNQREDQELLNLVRECGPHNWVDISTRIRHRTPKQCRERYHQNLKPTLNHSPITYEEGREIIHYFHELGPKWAEIARHLKGRSDNSIKNWWNGSVNRRRRQEQHEKKKQESSGRRLHHRDPISGHVRTSIYGLPDQRPLPSSLFIPIHRQYASPLVSPARSESTGEAPSLVSDNSAHSTPSPKTLSSPQIHLPPMMTMNEDTRRSNLVRLHTSSTGLDLNSSRLVSNERQPLASLNREHYDCMPKPSSHSGGPFRGTVSEPTSASSYTLSAFSNHQAPARGPDPTPPNPYRISSLDNTRRRSRMEEPLSPRSCTLPPIHGLQNPSSAAPSLSNSSRTNMTSNSYTGHDDLPDTSSKVSVKSLLC